MSRKTKYLETTYIHAVLPKLTINDERNGIYCRSRTK